MPKQASSVRDQQELHVARLMRHAALHSPHYSSQDWAGRVRSGQKVHLSDIPITPARLAKADPAKFYSTFVPGSEGAVIDKFTSGSTGEPTHIKHTQRQSHCNKLENARLRLGWGFERHMRVVHTKSPRDVAERGVVREVRNARGASQWQLNSHSSTLIIDLLRKTRATCLIGFPSEILAVLEQAPDVDFLTLISTVSEVVPQALTTLISKLPACRHYDAYGCVEAGIVAGKCSSCGQYHLASWHAIIEILDDSGRPAQPGALGRVVITPLFNLAMPLLRYDIGDFATIARKSSCSDESPVLSRIAGRERNLFKLPDGTRMTPAFDPSDALSLGIRKCKLVQISLTEVEMHYIPITPGSTLSESDAQRLVDIRLSPKLRAIPVLVEDIPAGPGGKYVMHECRI
jgi:phenylacetate-CoA ligase